MYMKYGPAAFSARSAGYAMLYDAPARVCLCVFNFESIIVCPARLGACYRVLVLFRWTVGRGGSMN